MPRPCIAFLASMLFLPASAQDAAPKDAAAVPQPSASAPATDVQKVAASSLGRCFSRQPAYPREALRNEEQGRTLMAFTVEPSGEIKDASLLRSSGFPALDHAALAHLNKCISIASPSGNESIPAGRYVLPMLWRLE